LSRKCGSLDVSRPVTGIALPFISVFLRFEVLTVVSELLFWGVTPCSLIDKYEHFGRTLGLYLQGRKVKTRAPGS
jgi:hypothetical protein